MTNNTVNTVAYLIASVVAVVVAVATSVTVFWRSRLNSPSEWRASYLAERQKSDDLEQELNRQRELKHNALNEVATLRAATDLTVVMRALADGSVKQTELFGRLEDRIEAQTEILSGLLIAVKALNNGERRQA